MAPRVLPVLIAACLVLASSPVRADEFDYYTRPVLDRVPEADGVKELKQLSMADIANHDEIIKDLPGAFIAVKTNGNRWCKLIVQSARRKIDEDKTVPMLLIQRFTTFREGEERTIFASGQNINLFNGFRFGLDIGQVVPPELDADVRFVVDGDKMYVEPVGKAKLYLLTKVLPDVIPKKGAKIVIGETFEPRYFTGTYKLYDDGRRTGTLKLIADNEGQVTGAYYSDKDDAKYDVSGRVGNPKHTIQFTIRFPRTEQIFQGAMFTGDGKAITGLSHIQTKETGFYAVRVED